MNQSQFLCDENVEPSLHAAARQRLRDAVVWAVSDPGAPPFGVLDPEILQWCEVHFFILVTNNRASMPVHLSKPASTWQPAATCRACLFSIRV